MCVRACLVIGRHPIREHCCRDKDAVRWSGAWMEMFWPWWPSTRPWSLLKPALGLSGDADAARFS